MKYDEALQKLETIVNTIENGEALSMEDYKKKATEAKKLLDYCQCQLLDMEKDLNTIIPKG